MIFVNSMSDLFHEGVPDDYIETVASDGEGELAHLSDTHKAIGSHGEPPERAVCALPQRHPHIWWGVSVENRAIRPPADFAISRNLLRFVRFLSIEPLLEDWARQMAVGAGAGCQESQERRPVASAPDSAQTQTGRPCPEKDIRPV